MLKNIKKNCKIKFNGGYWKVTNILKDYIFLEALEFKHKPKHIIVEKKEFKKEIF